MDPSDLSIWPTGTNISYDCGVAIIDTNSDMSTFTINCFFNTVTNLYEWRSTEGYSKVPKCVMGEYCSNSFISNSRQIETEILKGKFCCRCLL